MSETELDRRTFIKGAGAAAGVGAVGGVTLHSPQLSPVDEVAAFPPLGAVVIAATAGGWLLRDHEIIGSDAPPEGLTPETLIEQSYTTARARHSTNNSTFIDNKNIVQNAEQVAFADGKAAAVDAIRDDESQSAVSSAAQQAVDEHFTTVMSNFLKSWNETLMEIQNTRDLIEDHPDVSIGEVYHYSNSATSTGTTSGLGSHDGFVYVDDGQTPNTGTRTIELPDGSDFDLEVIGADISGGGFDRHAEYDPIEVHTSDGTSEGTFIVGILDWDDNDYNHQERSDDTDITATLVAHYDPWHEVWEELDNAHDSAIDNVINWVDNAYSAVQDGDLEPDDLILPTDLADEFSDSNALAIADLMALNIPIEAETEVKIQLSDEYDTTMRGLLATSDTGNVGTLSEGDTINPNATDEDDEPLYETWYIAFDNQTWAADITHYHDEDYGIQDSELRFEQNPAELYGQDYTGSVEYVVQTTDDETRTVEPSDFDEQTDENDEIEYWSVDLDLDQGITSVGSITAYKHDDVDDRYETMILEDTFEVLEADEDLEFEEPREPHEDDNYITREEWEDNYQRSRDQIEVYVEAQESGGIGGGAGFIDDLTDFGASAVQMVVGGMILLILFLFGLNAASS